MNIPIYKPELPPYEAVEPDIREMYASGLLYPGKFTERLKEQVSGYTSIEHVLPVASCSLGLILMLNAGWAPGSKVIIPAFTFNATLQALEWNQLTPVVVDVDGDGQLRPDLVEDALSTYSDVVAVVPVHMWGNACYPEEYEKMRLSKNVDVLFDGAHVFGTTYKGRHLAEYGTATAHSIAATKPVSAGEGGLVLTRFLNVKDYIEEGASHGLVGSLDTRTRGINGKIQEFNSILAYHAINRFSVTKERRATLLGLYREGFSDLPIRIWKTKEYVDASYKDCVLFTNTAAERDRLEVYLNEKGVGTKRYFDPAIPDMGSFSGIVHSADTARILADTCLTLPLYPSLTNREIEYIIRTVKDFFNKGLA